MEEITHGTEVIHLKNLRAEMSRYGVSVAAIAGVIGCSEKTVRNKISGESEFTVSEAMRVKKAMFPSLEIEYLFASDPISE